MRAVLAVLAAALCFSTTGTARAVAGVDASAVSVGAARVLIGGGVLALVAWSSRPRTPVGVTPVRRGWGAVAVGALGVLTYQPAFFLGTQLNGVAIGTVVALGSAPVLTGLAEGILTRRPPRAGWWVATAVAIVGVVLVSGLLSGPQAAPTQPVGILASVGAGAAYAAYTLASKALLDDGWTPARTMGTVFGSAAALSVPVLAVSGVAWLATPRGALLAGWLGLVTTALAYLLFGWGLARLSASTTSTLTLAEPLSAALLGVLVVGERLDAQAAAGIVVVLVGLLLLGILGRRQAGPPPM